MEAIAKTKYLKGSPRKARLVVDLIRGRNVSQALAILKFTDKRAAQPIAKCLNSAIANATYLAEQENIAIDPDDLWVKSCFVDMGPTKNRRRMRPAPQGRAYREQRHYCHITVLVSSDAPVKAETEKPVKKSAKDAEKVTGKAKAETGAKVEKTAKNADQAKEKKTKKATEETAEVKETKKQEVPAVEETISAVPEEVTETTAEASEENKPLAAQTDEEKTGSKPAADAQEDINEELERQ